MGTLITPGGHSRREIQVTAGGDGLKEDGMGYWVGRKGRMGDEGKGYGMEAWNSSVGEKGNDRRKGRRRREVGFGWISGCGGKVRRGSL